MRLDQMRYLSDLQQTHSISKTARRFFVSQQSLSNNIKQLENELNVTLLERSASGVMLTAQAEALLALSDPFLEHYDQLLERFAADLQSGIEELPDEIEVYTSSVLAGIVLPSAISAFSKKYPSIQLRIHEASYQEIFPAIVQNKCQLAFFSINEEYFLKQLKLHSREAITYHVLLTDRLVGCVSSKSSLAKKDIIERIDMVSHFFTYLNVVPLASTNVPLDQFKIKRSMPLYAGSNVDFHRRILRESDAVSMMPSYAYMNLFDNKHFVAKPLEGSQQIVYHAVLYAGTQISPVLKEFVQIAASFI